MKKIYSILSRVKSGTLHPEELSLLYWIISTCACISLLIILSFSCLSAPEEHSTELICTAFVMVIYGVAILYVSGALPTVGAISATLKKWFRYGYMLICKLLELLLGKTPAPPSAEWAFSILSDFLSYVFNSQAQQLPFFQTLFYEEIPIMGSKQKCLKSDMDFSSFLYNDVIPIYCISAFRIGHEMLSVELLNQGQTVINQMLSHALGNGQLSLGNYPPCYVKGFPTLYLLKTYDTGSYVRFYFAWINSKKVADAVRAFETPANEGCDSDDEDF